MNVQELRKNTNFVIGRTLALLRPLWSQFMGKAHLAVTLLALLTIVLVTPPSPFKRKSASTVQGTSQWRRYEADPVKHCLDNLQS